MIGVTLWNYTTAQWWAAFLLFPAALVADFELTFAPIDGMVFASEFELTTEIERDGEVVARYKTRNIRDWQYKRDGDGWVLTSNPREMELEGNRDAIEAAIQIALLNRPLTYQLDLDGNVVAVTGLEGLGEELQEELPGDIGPKVAAVINEESQTWRAFLQHQSTFGDLSGRSIAVGDSWQQDESIQSPFGIALKTQRHTEVAAIQTSGDLVFVVLRYSNASNPDAFREVLDSLSENDDVGHLAGEIGLHEIGERIFDGATLNLISERIIKVLTLPIQLADGKIITERRIERQVRSFVYPTLDALTLPEASTEPLRPPGRPSRAR